MVQRADPEGLSQDTAEGMENSGEVRGRFRKKR